MSTHNLSRKVDATLDSTFIHGAKLIYISLDGTAPPGNNPLRTTVYHHENLVTFQAVIKSGILFFISLHSTSPTPSNISRMSNKEFDNDEIGFTQKSEIVLYLREPTESPKQKWTMRIGLRKTTRSEKLILSAANSSTRLLAQQPRIDSTRPAATRVDGQYGGWRCWDSLVAFCPWRVRERF